MNSLKTYLGLESEHGQPNEHTKRDEPRATFSILPKYSKEHSQRLENDEVVVKGHNHTQCEGFFKGDEHAFNR